MKIEILDEVAEKIGFNATEMLEILSVWLYKSKKDKRCSGRENSR